MCDKAVEWGPRILQYFPDQYKTQEMCGVTVKEDVYVLHFVLDKTHEMCQRVAL